MSVYYNENDPFAAASLRELIKKKHIADGEVDERSIKEVHASELVGFKQIHLFAGCGGWSVALRLAGVADDFPVWTGSAPCQPFSSAGRRKAANDERHLWPEMYRLIRECKPAIVFGEQVASAISFGWLDLVFDEMEAINYACGAAVLPACGVGARHIRERLWWVANADSQRFADSEGRGSMRAIIGNRAVAVGCSQVDWRERWAAEPEMGCVVHGVQSGNRAVHIFGNSIVPQVAAEFIAAHFDVMSDTKQATEPKGE